MGGRHRDSEPGEHHDGEHGTHLDTEATGGRLEGQAVAKSGHDVVAHGHETNVKSEGSVDKEPGGHSSLLGDVSRGEHQPDGGQGGQCIGDVVGSVRDGEEEAGGELKQLEHLLRLRGSLKSLGVHLHVLRAQLADVHPHARGDVLSDSDIEGILREVLHGLEDTHVLSDHADLALGVAAKRTTHDTNGGLHRVHLHGHAVGLHGHARGHHGHSGHGSGSRGHHRGAGVHHARHAGHHGVSGRSGMSSLGLHIILLGGGALKLVVAVRALGDGPVVEHGVVREVLLVLDGTAEPWHNEDGAEDREEDADGDGDGHGGGVRSVLEGWDALEHHEASHDAKSQEEVQGEVQEATLEGLLVGVDKHEVLDGQVEHGSEDSSQDGGDEPGGNNSEEAAVIVPLHAINAPCGHTDAKDGSDHCVSGGDRHAEESSAEHPASGAEVHARHAEGEDVGVLIEVGDVHHLFPHSVHHGLAEGNNADELANAGDHAGLPVGDGLGANSVGKGIGHIVGSDGEGIKESPPERPHNEADIEPLHPLLG
mmetsp:Transcript_5678/g.9008  ORF Transcript_5678/g.9008 Transcript_5678/m.9008 type:complete len:537 (+) Transcript_5678:282-1892(+)